jgi:uncharacterized protein (TIGR02246 family)
MKTRIALVMAVLASGAAWLWAADAAESEIRVVEQQMHDAYVKHDVPLFASLYAEDSTFTHATGRTVSKAERVKEFTAPYPDLKDDLQRIRVYGNVAIVNDRSDYTARTDHRHVALQITRVWMKREGRCQVVSFQSTNIAQ